MGCCRNGYQRTEQRLAGSPQEMYNAANAQGGQQAGPQGGPQGGQQQGPKNDGEVTDVDFEEVK